MSLRISVADARRLGLLKKERASSGRPKKRTETSTRLPRTSAESGDAGIEFFIPLAPRPKERARTFMDEAALARAFRACGGDFGRFMAMVRPRVASGGGDVDRGVMKTITPKETREFEEAVGITANMAMKQAGREPFTCPVELEAEFVIEGDEMLWPTAQSDGDLDNLEKALLDGMNRIVYLDDRLVVRKTATKRCGECGHILVRVRPARG